ncbi:MAG: protein-disulfide reductase DsbD [Neisseriaceae bacterium]|nr:protein-disulfide reductase DsbD [Neisseriaceae bacterium]
MIKLLKQSSHALSILIFGLFAWSFAQAEVNPDDLLPPEKAFVPTLTNGADGVSVSFVVADGYYLYKNRVTVSTDEANVLGEASFSDGVVKTDDFFGTQTVFYTGAKVSYPYLKPNEASFYTLTLGYQGCADVGICYPPTEKTYTINTVGVIVAEGDAKAAGNGPFFLGSDNASDAETGFALSRDTLAQSLLAFFIAGIGLSFTACMYPLLPIVSSIIVGDQGSASKKRGFALSLIYVQGLALTYTLVGVIAGVTGALLTVWLQQPAVVLTSALLLVLLAFGMFGAYQLQMPSWIQNYFNQKTQSLSGGKITSVFVMGMFSALIVGPCVAPPLAFALGYIGQTGDAALGGMALYALALGMGVPLILIGTFGKQIMPKAGYWMGTVKYFFGLAILATALYMATAFLPYALVVSLYALLLLAGGVLFLRSGLKIGFNRTSGFLVVLLGATLAAGSAYFAYQSMTQQLTSMHRFLNLYPKQAQSAGHKYTDVAELKQAMTMALEEQPGQPILLDFYADWCVTCIEMEHKTLNQPEVTSAIDMQRFFTVDVTANTPEHQALLKEFGLYGPPGIFIIKADGSRSPALLGFANPAEFIKWYEDFL